MPDFSYQSNVAPYASKFFDDVGADSRLSASSRASIQGRLLDGMDDIETQRNKLEAQRLGLATQRQAFEKGGLELEAARDRRAKIGNASGIAKSILDSADDPEIKRQKLARAALDYADDDDAVKTFGLAHGALPKEREAKPTFTPGQSVEYATKLLGQIKPEVVQSVMAKGDPLAISYLLQQAGAEDERDKEAEKLRKDQSKEAADVRKAYAEKPLKWMKPPTDSQAPVDYEVSPGVRKSLYTDDKGKPLWLDEESTATARQILNVLDPDSLDEFDAMKDEKSDRARALLVENVQNRHLLKLAQGGEGAAASGGKAKGHRLVP